MIHGAVAWETLHFVTCQQQQLQTPTVELEESGAYFGRLAAAAFGEDGTAPSESSPLNAFFPGQARRLKDLVVTYFEKSLKEHDILKLFERSAALCRSCTDKRPDETHLLLGGGRAQLLTCLETWIDDNIVVSPDLFRHLEEQRSFCGVTFSNYTHSIILLFSSIVLRTKCNMWCVRHSV